ncbi:tyrosine-protein phosphatase [Mangrovimicrobium sediminis]|uniref:Tyrosine-protein phosphatase n=1 Tax=Mangrovimicrobium sediminis TaxID=2562682 RepID=A0A4Z0LVZ5_9GAMM|nr:tyrosine-protein phosphatase [Haliea sp. SAOS-164]TGD71316.1 tyrosine-protein phosphatase [Haliea sp. SAOS-164]
MNYQNNVRIEREANGDYVLYWDDNFSTSPVEIYAADSPAAAMNGTLVGTGTCGSVRIDTLREPVRHYFHLVPEGKTGTTVGERALSVGGGMNLRDLGGYRTGDGRQVRWGKLYRSGKLSIATQSGMDYLSSLGLKVNCDFRVARDFTGATNTLPDEVEALNLPVDAGSFSTFFKTITQEQLNEAAMVETMREVNRQLVTQYQDEYRQMFAALLALEDGGFLVNCTAGKDRTGYAAALILHALGVPRETIVHDYLLSARYFSIDPNAVDHAAMASKYPPEVLAILKSDATKPLGEVRSDYLEAAFSAMEAASGSVERYLEEVLGVGEPERAVLRERYTTNDQ